jgi:hypothetical protein
MNPLYQLRASITRAVFCAVAGLALAAVPARAQSCRGPDQSSAHMLAYLKKLVASPDTVDQAARWDLFIPEFDSSRVTLETSTRVCDKVLAAFKTTLPADFPTPLPTSLYVAKVDKVYVAMAPVAGAHTYPYAVIDSRYTVLSTYAQ